MKRKNLVYLLSAAVLSGALGMSGCGDTAQVSQDTVVSDDGLGKDETAVPDETDIPNETIAEDEPDDMENGTEEDEGREDKVYEPIQRIEKVPIDAGESESEEDSGTYYYDEDLDLVRNVTIYSSWSMDHQYEYLTDEAGNKVKGFNVLAYGDGDTDVHTEESLLTNWDGELYEYDSENRLVRITSDIADYNVSYGEHTVEITPTPENSASYEPAAYEFSEDGHLISFKGVNADRSGRFVHEYQYDEYGNCVLKREQNIYDDREDSEYTTVWEYEYDEEGRPFSIKEIYEEDMIRSVIISYNEDGQVTEESYFWKDYKGNNYERVRTYTYGEDRKLVSTAVNGAAEWELGYEESSLETVSHYDLTKDPSLEGVGITSLNGLDFVSQYIDDYTGVEFPGVSGYQYTIVYEDL